MIIDLIWPTDRMGIFRRAMQEKDDTSNSKCKVGFGFASPWPPTKPHLHPCQLPLLLLYYIVVAGHPPPIHFWLNRSPQTVETAPLELIVSCIHAYLWTIATTIIIMNRFIYIGDMHTASWSFSNGVLMEPNGGTAESVVSSLNIGECQLPQSSLLWSIV